MVFQVSGRVSPCSFVLVRHACEENVASVADKHRIIIAAARRARPRYTQKGIASERNRDVVGVYRPTGESERKVRSIHENIQHVGTHFASRVLLLAMLVGEPVIASDGAPATKIQSADRGVPYALVDNDANATAQATALLTRPVAIPAAPIDSRPVATTAAPADFHVGDGSDFFLVQDGHICLHVVLRATFSVTFASDAAHSKKSQTTTVDLPKQSFRGSGSCGQDRAKLVISWANQNYTLTFNVRRYPDLVNSTDGHLRNVTKWAVTRIEFKFDTSDVSKFKTPLKPALRTVTSAQQQPYFATPANFSYFCRSRQDIPLAEHGVNTSAIESVVVSVWGVRIQAPVDGPRAEPDVVHCSADLASELGQTSLAPVITAACLAVVVIIIVVAYSCVKQKNKMYYRAVD
ncbi:hypothetical protein LSAT2_031986 [Lamellibrachia satsuma]|nr:hypothetical protein LSAT2_031986 [Lamellibrachia satsuma]